MKNNKVLALIVLILIFVLAACGGGDVDSEAIAEQTSTENTATQSDNTEAEMETAVSLADEVRVDEGGFAFQPPVGYEVSIDSLFAEMVASDDSETQINLFGFPLMEGMDLNTMYEGATAEFASDDTVNLSEREDISVNGLDGFSAIMSGEEDSVLIKGRVIVLGNDAQGVFVLAGAEESKWDGGVAEQVDAIINSISLFEIVMPELMEEVEEPAEAEEPEAVEEADAAEEVVEEADSDADAAPEFDTVFPIPADAVNLIGEGGEADLIFQTSLTLEEALAFYRTELIAEELTERDLLTVVDESVFSIVFDGSENGKAIVVQGVDLGESTNISIRFEEL